MNAFSSRAGGRWLVMLLVLVAAGFVGLALEGSRSAAEDSAAQGVPGGQATRSDALDGAVPVASMATETSKTYRRPDGTFITRVFAQETDSAANIDATSDGFRATAGDVEASFPETLADPLRIVHGGDWVSLQLRHGAGQARASGSTISYDEALPGAGVEYMVSSGAVGEEIHLTGDQAPSSFVFDVRASDGIHAAKQANGTISMTSADGHRVFGLSPSYAYADRSPRDTESVDTDLAAVDGGWRITLSVDAAWLHDALAGGEVTIDPTVYLNGATQDCGLSSATPSVSYCANGQLWVGYNGISDNHTLVKWDLSAIPKDAVALWGDASLYQAGSAPANAKSLSLHRLTRDWTSGASWSTYDGTHQWTTAGGDFDATPAASALVPAGHTGWTDWMVTPLVQHWIDGSQPNYGIAVQDKPSPQVTGQENFYSTEGTTPDQAPELDIAWSPRTGSVDASTLEGQSLDPKTTAQINVANGNLLLTTNDINAPGTGLDLRFDHYYNSLLDGDDSAALGVRTTASLGRDLRLRLYYGDVVSFERGDGVRAPFIDPVTSGSTTTWTAPYELSNATLSRNNTTNKYTLRLPAGLPSQPGKDLTLSFDSTGKLTTLADQAGHTISQSYYSGGDVDWPTLHGITDTNNAAWTVSQGSLDEERIADILSPDNHHTTFGYLTTGRYLSQVTEADNTTNTYGYDSSKRITSITTPDGNVTKITYNGSSTKVASIIRTNNPAHTTGPTTTITYNSPTTPCQSSNFDYTKNVVSRPDSSSTTYCANNHAQITYDTDNPIQASPSGEWYDLRDSYTQGTGTHTITLNGADAGSGVKRQVLEEVGGAEIAAATLPCDPRNALAPTACPHASTQTATFSPSGLAEGSHIFRQVTTDYGGRTTMSAPWTVTIDRSAPTLASDVEAMLGDDGQTTVYFGQAADPPLAGGVAGSGVGLYTYRYQLNGGMWSAWSIIGASGFTIPGLADGQAVTVEATVADEVGNTSAVVAGTATVIQVSGFEDREVVSDTETADPLGPDTCYSDPEFPDGYCGDDETGEAGGSALRAALPTTGWGLSDSNRAVNIFADSRLAALGLTWYRRIVPWNIAVAGPAADAKRAAGQPLTNDEELASELWAELHRWLAGVAQQNSVSGATAHPLISFERCVGTFSHQGTSSAPCRTDTNATPHVVAEAPTVAEYKTAVQAFLQDTTLAAVHDFTAWNEPNHGKTGNEYQPTWDKPKLAGQYWRVLDTLCRAQSHQCRVGAGDFLDTQMQNAAGDPTAGGARYMNLYKQGMGYPSKAKYWAWHAYSEGEDALMKTGDDRWTPFRHFLHATNYNGSPDVWLTEQGVVLHANSKVHVAGRSTSKANSIMRAYVADSSALTKVSTRTKRFFYYQWVGEPDPNQDSGLISYVGSHNARDLYTIYKGATNP
jgi:YD repeat-containing protein